MNAAQLESTLTDSLRGTRLIVVANREPYIHIRRRRNAKGLFNWLRGRKETERIEWTRPASGLVTALDPVMRACGGTWIAHGSGNADRDTAESIRRFAIGAAAPVRDPRAPARAHHRIERGHQTARRTGPFNTFGFLAAAQPIPHAASVALASHVDVRLAIRHDD